MAAVVAGAVAGILATAVESGAAAAVVAAAEISTAESFSAIVVAAAGILSPAGEGAGEQFNYNVSLLALLWSFRNLGVKM